MVIFHSYVSLQEGIPFLIGETTQKSRTSLPLKGIQGQPVSHELYLKFPIGNSHFFGSPILPNPGNHTSLRLYIVYCTLCSKCFLGIPKNTIVSCNLFSQTNPNISVHPTLMDSQPHIEFTRVFFSVFFIYVCLSHIIYLDNPIVGHYPLVN